MTTQDALEEANWRAMPSAFWHHPRRWDGPTNPASQRHLPFWMYLDQFEMRPLPARTGAPVLRPVAASAEWDHVGGVLKSIQKTMNADGEVVVHFRYERGERTRSLEEVRREYPSLSAWVAG